MKLVSAHIYPVKSLRGMDMEAAYVERRGFRNDRRWMVTTLDGHHLTQREHPILATIRAEPEDGAIRLHAPGFESIRIEEPTDQVRKVRIWRDDVQAIVASSAACSWLSDAISADVLLVFQPASFIRTVNQDFGREDDIVSFADGYPLLVTSTGSLDALNEDLESPVPMNRFRPNLVVDAEEPWVEDRWKRLHIGQMSFRVVKPCVRCVVTTINQESGEKDGTEPLRTLSRVHLVDGRALFGMNVIPDQDGWIHIGDAVEAFLD